MLKPGVGLLLWKLKRQDTSTPVLGHPRVWTGNSIRWALLQLCILSKGWKSQGKFGDHVVQKQTISSIKMMYFLFHCCFSFYQFPNYKLSLDYEHKLLQYLLFLLKLDIQSLGLQLKNQN